MGELPETGLVRLAPHDREQLEAFADLHEVTLPESVPVQFGRRFMTRFYFPKLVADGLAVGDLFRFEGKWAGYTLYTKTPHTMLRDAIKKHFTYLCRLMPIVFLTKPRAVLALPKLIANQGGFPQHPHTGYFLTFGVHPDFRGRAVGGSRISSILMQGMFDYFREQGFDAIEATVDADNTRALRFYRSCGFRIEERGLDGGKKLQVRREL